MSQDLAIFLSSEFSEEDVLATAATVESMASVHAWTLGPPAFVDEVDATPLTNPEDEPIRTVGAVLEVTTPGANSDTSRDEVQAFVSAMAALSGARHLN